MVQQQALVNSGSWALTVASAALRFGAFRLAYRLSKVLCAQVFFLRKKGSEGGDHISSFTSKV